ncbi:hypothetical protein X777_15173, partial [Ooceraea biroi]
CFQKIIARNSEITSATTGNCIALDNTPILNTTSTLQPEKAINKTSTIITYIYPFVNTIKTCLDAEKVIRFIMKEKYDVTLNFKYIMNNIQTVLLNLYRAMIKVFLRLTERT